jgi:Na+-translocating ferredoxin:NAD+ oxidoreductase RnfE subunit
MNETFTSEFKKGFAVGLGVAVALVLLGVALNVIGFGR